MRVKLEITSGAYLCGAIGILILPADVLIGAFLAAAVHELFHLLMLRILRVPVHRIQVGWGGARILCRNLTPLEEFLCAAAGPIGSFLLLLIRQFHPVLAFLGMLQGLFNLIPVYPLDGGRMLHAALNGLFPGLNQKALRWISLAVLLVPALLIALKRADSVPIILALFAVICKLSEKLPCKGERKRVQ